jgi:hypothetical protein
MDLPSKHVLYLAKRIGARGAGSDGEAAAASYVLRTLSDLDVEIDIETFSSWKSDLHGLLIIYGLVIASYLIFRVSYTASLVMSMLLFFIFQMETYTWAVLSRLLPHSSASNVIGRVAPSGSAKEKVLLVANYDSPRSSPLGRPRVARFFRVFYIISFACIIAIMLTGIFGVGASLTKISHNTINQIWLYAGPFAAFLIVMCIIIMLGELRGRFTAGANDNASGVGVLLSVMASLSANPLENTEVWGLAAGRGCAGARGMIAFLHRHKHLLHGASIINLDHCGVGETRIATREGVMFGFRCSWRLRGIAQGAARSTSGIDLDKGRCRVKKSDGMAAIVRGYRAITICGLKGGTYQGWRNANDTLDTLDRSSLDRAVKLVGLMLDSIDAGPKRRGPRRRGRARQKEIEELIAPEGEVVAQEPAEDLPEEPSED